MQFKLKRALLNIYYTKNYFCIGLAVQTQWQSAKHMTRFTAHALHLTLSMYTMITSHADEILFYTAFIPYALLRCIKSRMYIGLAVETQWQSAKHMTRFTAHALTAFDALNVQWWPPMLIKYYFTLHSFHMHYTTVHQKSNEHWEVDAIT